MAERIRKSVDEIAQRFHFLEHPPCHEPECHNPFSMECKRCRKRLCGDHAIYEHRCWEETMEVTGG